VDKRSTLEIKQGKLTAKFYPLKRFWLLYGLGQQPFIVPVKHLYSLLQLMCKVVEADDRAQAEAKRA